MEKKAIQGMRFMPGEALYQIADLSSVWVVADVFEQDIGLVKLGSKASVQINAYPDKKFTGTITYVYPTLKAETRTVPVRIELANPGLLLKPSMFAQVEVSVATKDKAVTIPLSAVIDSGTRQLALVSLADGRFEPRDVKLGARSSTYVEVLDGIKADESVVVSANFLIDAESNLKAAVGGFSKPAIKANSHQAIGAVVEFDAKEGTIDIDHAAIESLKWPAMTMQFKVANASLLEGLKPGTKVTAEFVERKQGEWVVTALTRQAEGGAPPARAVDHSAHTAK
jgi:Cu(I)/Ag(I) efflux system membrane fusion protein